MSELALIKDRKLLRMAKNPADAGLAIASGEADAVHKVNDLAELQIVLNSYEQAEKPEDGYTDSVNLINEWVNGDAAKLRKQLKTLSGDIKAKGEAALKSLRDGSQSALEDIRKVIHEATKPKEK